MEDLSAVESPTHNNLQKLGAQYADGIILGEEKINDELNSYISSLEKPILECQLEESYIEQYSQFYDAILESEEVLVE